MMFNRMRYCVLLFELVRPPTFFVSEGPFEQCERIACEHLRAMPSGEATYQAILGPPKRAVNHMLRFLRKQLSQQRAVESDHGSDDAAVGVHAANELQKLHQHLTIPLQETSRAPNRLIPLMFRLQLREQLHKPVAVRAI